MRTKRTLPPEPPCLYKGADSCDFAPGWSDSDAELVALLKACHDADPDELTPQLVLADWLCDHRDPRETWVRVGCDLWQACRTLEPGRAAWHYDAANAALAPVCETAAGWRLACLWGCLVAWHGPAGWGGKAMGRTWVDLRVRVVNRCVWWWSLGFLGSSQADAALSQADAAWSQADAALSQADAAWRQADAAWSQADAALSQADAALSQADAAWRQADAALSQADAAWSQAYAAGSQADAAWRQADAAWRQADAALSQADAAGRQADAALSQADAALSQADAVLSQADAAGRQADAAWSQAYAAGSQADAAWRQAYAAGSQAYAAGSQANAAWRQARERMWRWARRAWELCIRELPLLEDTP